jgi:murein DD-endopeptidase MepM/ murein hydrolase activator NlpD
MRAIAFMWVTVDAGSAVPNTLRHRVTGRTQPVEGGVVRVSAARPIVLGPPLRGADWLAANGPANGSGHRRAIIPIEGRTPIAQRFAIDWVRFGPDRATFTGDRLDNKNYRAYGAEILAVADGVVTSIKDGIPENVPGPASRAVPITLETIGGNYVVLDLGGGRFAFYAHMQPGSVRVKAGDRVRRGRVLGLVGNSGNSTEPHLHFHLGASASPLGAEGIPYVIESFETQNAQGVWERRRNELPLANARVRFP